VPRFTRTGTFEITTERQGGTVTLSPRGELDIATAHRVAQSLLAVEHEEDVALTVVDLAELTFVDVAGLRALVEAAWRAGRRGRQITFVEARPEIRRTVGLVGLDLVATLGARSEAEVGT
jgi:anti-anti-sigma factor